jgi:hypothetical protein
MIFTDSVKENHMIVRENNEDLSESITMVAWCFALSVIVDLSYLILYWKNYSLLPKDALLLLIFGFVVGFFLNAIALLGTIFLVSTVVFRRIRNSLAIRLLMSASPVSLLLGIYLVLIISLLIVTK